MKEQTPLSNDPVHGFESFIDENEVIIWAGKPCKGSYIFKSIASGILLFSMGLIWLIMTLIPKFCKVTVVYENTDKDSIEARYFWVVGMAIFVFGLFRILEKWRSYPNTLYALSDKKIMIRTGWKGTKFIMINHDTIIGSHVDTNFVDEMNNTGSIAFYSGKTEATDDGTQRVYDYWVAIADPHEIHRKVQRAGATVKIKV